MVQKDSPVGNYISVERVDITPGRIDRHSVRSDLERGLEDETIMKRHGLTRMQLAGHKAAITRQNGNGNGKKGNGDKTELTEEQNSLLYEDLMDSGFSDEQIMEKYKITRGQLSARKAILTRALRGICEGREDYQDSEDLILRRDNYACQYCGRTDAENHETSGHSLHEHHIDYNHGNCDERNRISLCTSCHAKTNTIQHGPKMREVLEARIKAIYSERREEA